MPPLAQNARHLDRVNFELSNRCNMAHVHPRCPAHREEGRPPENLASAVVFGVLEDLGALGFTGCLSFHQYGEPMMDPRLFWFLERAARVVPMAKTLVWTNGSTLEEHLLGDLQAVGLGHLAVTAYTPAERIRLQALEVPPGFLTIYAPNWVELFGIYDAPLTHSAAPCYAPLTDLIVTRTGQVGLCCRDWERRYTFGDLTRTPFREVLASPALTDLYARLSTGDRCLDICKRCRTVRDWRGAHGAGIVMRKQAKVTI